MSSNEVTWETISKYFKETDKIHMRNVTGGTLDLNDCESVRHWAKQIYVAVSNKVMPPGGWDDSKIKDFKAWMDAGAKCPSSQESSEITAKKAQRAKRRRKS